MIPIDHNLIHVIEFFPLILSCILFFIGIKNDSKFDAKTVILICIMSGMFISIQLSWWMIHFIGGVQRLPMEHHLGWSLYDSIVMLFLIHILRGK